MDIRILQHVCAAHTHTHTHTRARAHTQYQGVSMFQTLAN